MEGVTPARGQSRDTAAAHLEYTGTVLSDGAAFSRGACRRGDRTLLLSADPAVPRRVPPAGAALERLQAQAGTARRAARGIGAVATGERGGSWDISPPHPETSVQCAHDAETNLSLLSALCLYGLWTNGHPDGHPLNGHDSDTKNFPVSACTQLPLSLHRSQTVFGETRPGRWTLGRVFRLVSLS